MPAALSLHLPEFFPGPGWQDPATHETLAWSFQGVQLPAPGHRGLPAALTSFESFPCEEGFRCVSKISKFGTGHDFEKFASGKEPVPDKPGAAPVYEWGCPAKDLCVDDGDCICIARGSPNMHSELQNGHEKIIGTFMKQSSKDKVNEEQQPITVIPHYQIRVKDGGPFDVESPHSGLGQIKEYDRETWLDTYYEEAPKIQSALDKLRAAIDTTFKEKVSAEGGFVCDGAQAEGQQPSLTKVENQLMLMKIRRFQVLSNDCGNMRDTVAKLAGNPEKEEFAKTGKSEGGQDLKCFKKKDAQACQQLNCYKGFEDQGFQDRMQKFKTELDKCAPETDTPPDVSGSEKAAAPPDEAPADQPDEGDAGANLENEQQGDATEQSSIGFAGVALGAVLVSKRPPRSERGARRGSTFL